MPAVILSEAKNLGRDMAYSRSFHEIRSAELTAEVFAALRMTLGSGLGSMMPWKTYDSGSSSDSIPNSSIGFERISLISREL